MTDAERNRFMLGDLLVSPQHNKLSSQGRSLTLQPKVMAVLCYLAQHRDRVVSNEELLDHVWKGRVVTHASVQKSINALRNAFAELAGDKECIAHFSKRGYQLLLPVTPLEPEEPVSQQDSSSSSSTSNKTNPRVRTGLVGAGAVLLLGLVVAVLFFTFRQQNGPEQSISDIERHHVTAFKGIMGVTNETGHERGAEPHPDGRRIAYVKDIGNVTGRSQSQIMIRDERGRDWLLASVDGSWADLAWSPSGRNLVATEIRRAEGLPWAPAYFEKPNYLYTFHIFTLDFRGERLIEKNLLSQWQGVVESVTWWDENTIEFIASQGPNSVNERYRYVVADQTLSLHPSPSDGFVPLKSAVRNKISALVSQRRGSAQLEFIDARDQVLARWPLPTSGVDISWIPDGSGILLSETDNQKLYNVYLTGEVEPVVLPPNAGLSISRPRYSNDGETILLSAAQERAEFYLDKTGALASESKVASGNYANDSPLFSSDGNDIVFLSRRNGNYQLWRWHGQSEEQLFSFTKRPSKILWPADQDFLIYRQGKAIWQYHLGSRTPVQLLEKAERAEPLGYDSVNRSIWLVKQLNDVRNIWRHDLEKGAERQLTFGSVGSAFEYRGNIYFQYTGQPGLWLLSETEQNPRRISVNLPENSKLLRISQDAVFFVSGGPCRESPPQKLDLKTDTVVDAMQRTRTQVISHDFHPQKGVLHSHCTLPESNILKLTAQANEK